MAQVTFRAQATVSNDGSGTMTINKPAGTIDGDLMIAHASFSSQAGYDARITPSNWNVLHAITSGGGSGNVAIWWKIASSEGSSYDFGGTTGAGNPFIGYITTWFNNRSSSPIDTSSENDDTSSNTTATGAAITPTASPEAIMLFLVSGTNASTTVSGYAVANNNPTWTERYDAVSSSGGNHAWLAMASGPYTAITTTGVPTATLDVSNSAIVHMISILPSFNFSVDLLTVDTATPDVTFSYAASISVPVLAVDTATPDATVTQGDPEIVNSDKATISPSGVSKNSISPTNTSKNSISPTNVAKS